MGKGCGGEGGFHEILQVERDVTHDELRKAYKRAALRYHPDKGGRIEDFQAVQRAYEVLNDPYKRQLYEKYGEGMVKIVEGNGGPQEAVSVFSRISVAHRLWLILGICVIVSLIMLTPILVVLNWDETISCSWVVCFIPLWALHLLACCSLLVVPSPPEDMAPEEQRQWDDDVRADLRTRMTSASTMLLLVFLEIFVAMRLDGSVAWAWHMVLAPWSVLEFFSIVRKSIVSYRALQQQIDEQWPPPISWNIVRLAMSFTIAAKLDGGMDWGTAFWPLWAGLAFHFALLVRQCFDERSPIDGDMNSPTPQHLACLGMCGLVGLAVWMSLLLWRLEDPDSISAGIAMLPLFIPPYLLCCCISCAVCFMHDPKDTPEKDIEEPLFPSDQ